MNNDLKDRVDFLKRKNDELVREVNKKDNRISELEITIKTLKRLNGEDKYNG